MDISDMVNLLLEYETIAHRIVENDDVHLYLQQFSTGAGQVVLIFTDGEGEGETELIWSTWQSPDQAEAAIRSHMAALALLGV